METKECKKCKKCLAIKSVEDFHKDKGMKDGYKNYCRECYKAKIYSYGEKQGEEKREPYIKIGFNPISGKSGFIKKPKPIIIKNEIEGKECTRCEEWKPLTEYHKFRRMTYGLNIYCKTCDISAKKEYFHTEKGRNNSHRASAKRRSLIKGVKFTPYERAEILKRDKYTCQNCGIKVHDRSSGNWNTPNKAHLDHIVSLVDGGNTEPNNIQTLCRTCNLSKGATSKGVVQLALF